jgi:hypothetical protein
MIISYVCFIWLNTNAIYDYILKHNLFNRFRIIEEYNNRTADISFVLFLRSKECFWGKLLSCSICLTFWMSVAATVLTGGNTFVFAFFSLIFYRLLSNE